MHLSRHAELFLRRLCRIQASQFRSLNLQEYQSKSLLRKNGCTVQNFFIVDQNIADQESKLMEMAWDEYVVKAQILAGGRGKGHFIGAQKKGLSGVYITKSKEEASTSVNAMLGRRLITNQTSPEGVPVKKVMVAESVPISRETYLSIMMDPSCGPVVVACPLGGVDIEEIAAKQPALILKEPISVDAGISTEQCRKIAVFLSFTGKLLDDAAEQIRRLYNLFIKIDATQVEINPFAETADARVFCVDAKLMFDDNAAFRQKEIFEMADFEGMDAREIRAKKSNLSYIGLDGNIACLVNGAGLAMATMDIIKLHGGEPANFLDVGGGASVEQVKEAFKIITTDSSNLRAIFVNIFGGIMRCDVIAQGIITACSELQLKVPVVIRLKGTRVQEAKKLLQSSSSLGNFEMVDSFDDAARRAVKLAEGESSEANVSRSAVRI